MASLGLLGGLAAGFGALGKSVMADRERAMDEESEIRKAKLKGDIEMDLLKAKYEFTKQNPQYSKYVTNLQGDLIAFDQFGSPKIVYKASPEERSIRLSKAQSEVDENNAQAARATSGADKDAALLGSTLDLNAARAAAARAAAARGPKGAQPKPDPFTITPAARDKIVKQYMPKSILENYAPGDPEYDDALKAADERVTSEGYKVGRQPNAFGAQPGLVTPPDLGVFGQLLPQAAADDEDEDIMSY